MSDHTKLYLVCENKCLVEYSPLLGNADYIVEQGVTDIWTWRKWNSGIAECWGKYTVNDINPAKHENGGVYYSDVIDIDLPFQFLSPPIVNVDGGTGNGMIFPHVIGGSIRSVRFCMLAHTQTVTNVNINVSISVKGKWYIGGADMSVGYLTSIDKQEIVSAVLAALPEWEGGSY